MKNKSIIKTIFLSSFFSFYSLFSPNLIRKAETKELSENNQTQVCIQNLEATIDSVIKQPERSKENWGIVIKNIEEDKILYRLNDDKYLIPASNTKLLTTAGFLLKLGKDFTINTPVYIRKNGDGLEELIIWGMGDPSLRKSDLETIATKLKELNINHIDKVTLIENKFAEYPINNSWEFSDLYFFYAVPVNSLILDNNTVTLTLSANQLNQSVVLKWSDELAGKQWSIINEGITVSEKEQYTISLNPQGIDTKLKVKGNFPVNNGDRNWWLSIPNPSLYFQDSLEEILAQNLINVREINIINEEDFNLGKADLLLEFESPNGEKLVNITNQDSNNLYAEILLNYLSGDSDDKFTALNNILETLGISSQDYILKDGSGLSRQNLVTPQSLVTLLGLMEKSDYGDTFRNSLSLAGVNGTLKNRFPNNDKIKGNLWAKTGTLTGVSALSGYLDTNAQGRLIFSIIVNNSPSSNRELRNAIDSLVEVIARLEKC